MRFSGVVAAAVLAAVACGCSKQDEITRYRVERLSSQVAAKPARDPGKGGTPQQVLGAIFLRGEKAWFFKAFGPPAEMAALEGNYQTFLKSITFGDNGDPKWELPAGWRQLPGNQIRLATLRLGEGENAPEATVIGLPKNDGEDAKYLLDNVNRWRKQLQLGDWSAEQLKQELKIEKAGDAEYSFVSLTGVSDPAGGMTPPFAGNRPPRVERPETPAAPPSSDLKFDLPEGWKEVAPASSFTKAAFRAGDKESLEITISSAGGALVDNINRWRGQIKLPPLAEAELLPTLKDITIDGAAGKLVEIQNVDAEPHQAILGAIVEKNGMSWFVKARGPATVATEEKARFEAFVGSLKLP